MADEEARQRRTRRRFARRQWARRWGVWRWVVGGVVLLGLVGGGIWLVWFSTVLTVHGTTVSGTRYLTEDQVSRAAAVPTGRPLARVDLGRVRARVEALAPVRSAEVTRKWPHEILIVVTEREPVAVVELGTSLRGMDVDGVLFRDYPQRPESLPLVRLGASVDTSTRREVAGVIAVMPASLAKQVDHLEAQSIDQISLVLRDGRRVAWGSAQDSKAKAAVLVTLLATQKAEEYDVSVPSRPTTR